ncbi:MAG: universal stress protein [Bacteroidia bacterium]|nr:universal stress protein [Bacteroidia bacterium]
MKRILLPTDFSENSWNAIVYALQLFKDDDCTFYLLNTYTPIIYHVEYVLINPGQFGLGDAIRQTSLDNLEEFKSKILSDFPNSRHKIESKASFNTLISEIEDMVEEKGIDFIVMGTKGATGAKEVLFGTNTVQVIKHAKCPTIAIPEDFRFESPHEILFPADLEINFEERHINPLKSIAQAFVARINILHVSHGYELSEAQLSNKQKLETYIKGIANLYHDVRSESVTKAIDDFQIKAKINLLVMINNKHSFFENMFFKSTLNEIGFHLKIPFLVIPSKV